jgi:hypothetical protein
MLDSSTYKQWVREVLGPYLNGREGYLLLVSFSVHAKEENVIKVQGAGVEVDFIPSGYTPCLQVLNIGIHGTFKPFYGQNMQ